LVWIKICGFCDTESARVAVDLGVDAIGLNFVARSKRRITPQLARSMVDSLRGRVELVGVVESMTLQQAGELRDQLRLDSIQLHGCNEVGASSHWPAWAYLAVGISTERDAAELGNYPGERLLVDACLNGVTGGTGMTFDWRLIEEVSQVRRIIVAGGLTPENVNAALSATGASGADVATGVEFPNRPGCKDAELMMRFIQNARAG